MPGTYLAPIDIKLNDEADLGRMVRLDERVADVEQAKNLRIIVLDACSDNPLADELKCSIGTRARCRYGAVLPRSMPP